VCWIEEVPEDYLQWLRTKSEAKKSAPLKGSLVIVRVKLVKQHFLQKGFRHTANS
jgi:hypothetical protein